MSPLFNISLQGSMRFWDGLCADFLQCMEQARYQPGLHHCLRDLGLQPGATRTKLCMSPLFNISLHRSMRFWDGLCADFLQCMEQARYQPGLHHCLRDLVLQPGATRTKLCMSPLFNISLHRSMRFWDGLCGDLSAAWSKQETNTASITVSVIYTLKGKNTLNHDQRTPKQQRPARWLGCPAWPARRAKLTTLRNTECSTANWHR